MKTGIFGILGMTVVFCLSLPAHGTPITAGQMSLVDPECGKQAYQVLREDLKALQTAYRHDEIGLKDRDILLAEWSQQWQGVINQCLRDLRLRTIKVLVNADEVQPESKPQGLPRFPEERAVYSTESGALAQVDNEEYLGIHGMGDEMISPGMELESTQYGTDVRKVRRDMNQLWNKAVEEIVHGVERVD